MRGWYCVLLVLMAAGLQAAEPASTWKAGAAGVKITPDGPMWMAGYASRNKPSEGVAQDLFAKALVLQDETGSTAVLVTLDLISVPVALRNAVSEELQKRHQVPDGALLMNCSHTHCGPELRTASDFDDSISEQRRTQAGQYREQLQQRIVEAVNQAFAKLAPANISYQRARAGFAMNRRTPANGNWQNAPWPDGPVDHDVPVLRVEDAEGKLRAILFGYACHNTTLGFYQMCGDYAGYAQEYLQQEHPEAVALFLMGCGGDQNPYPRRTLELAQMHGRSLATAVNAALETPKRPVQGALRAALMTVDVAYAPAPSAEELKVRSESKDSFDAAWARRLIKYRDASGSLPEKYPAPVQVLRIGRDLILIALPGETVVDYSLRLKSELSVPDGPAVWVAGYSNNVFAYVPSRRVLLEGGYEGGGAMRYFTSIIHPGPFAPDIEERLIGGVHQLLKQTAEK